MNKIKQTKKVNDYLSIEYDIDNVNIVHVWYTSKWYAYDCLYDTKEEKFFAYSTLLDFLTETQKKLIKNKIERSCLK